MTFYAQTGSYLAFFYYICQQKSYQIHDLRQKYTNDMSIDSVFGGDYESAIIFCEKYVHER